MQVPVENGNNSVFQFIGEENGSEAAINRQVPRRSKRCEYVTQCTWCVAVAETQTRPESGHGYQLHNRAAMRGISEWAVFKTH